jgi:mono/diheme cytochrome c family protein
MRPSPRRRASEPSSPVSLAGTAALLACGLALLAASAGSAPSPPDGKTTAPEAAPRRDLAATAHEILAKRCFGCHGKEQTAGLDLRTREGALKGGARGPALTPGSAAASRLYQVIAGVAKPRMPPAGALPDAEVKTLQAWIDAGAPYPSLSPSSFRLPLSKTGWALRELKPPPVPPVRRKQWVLNPIDAFVLARLEEKGLSPAPVASRRELIRRLAFDLTGLPPTPEETERFLADRAPDAYGQLVERLLASPRYGERWARHWLDVARFAESQGFERDKIRDHAWRYRDYVIRAFNSDMPYDRFVREQLAGDVLPHPDAPGADGIVATGFLVGGPWDEVGSTQASAVMRARVREDELEEMVSAVSQTFLGLTVNCARCHDHKFDPIPQRDYYRLQAALAGVHHGDRSLLAPAEAAAREARQAGLKAALAEVEARMQAVDAAGRERVARRKPAARPALPSAGPAPIARWTFEGDAKDSAGHLDAVLSGGASLVNGRLRLNGTDGVARTGPLPHSVREKTLEAWVALATLDQPGGVLTLEDEAGHVFDGIVFGERQPRKWTAGSAFFARTLDLAAPEETSPPGSLVHLAITYGADNRIAVYRNGQPYGESYVPAAAPESALRTFAAGGSHLLFGLRHSEGARPGDGRWLHGEIEEARLYDRALTAAEVAASFRTGPSAPTEAEIQAALTEEETAARARLTQEGARLRAELAVLAAPPMAYAANPQDPPPVYVLKRGDLNAKGERVGAGGLSCIAPVAGDLSLPPDAPEAERRLKLAEWIASPKNPLTARVMVNRVWQYHFGRGLAGTPSDFGVNGEPPTHPELLDWLAYRFATGGGRRGTEESGLRSAVVGPSKAWSLKALHRLIVNSNTYKQSARPDPKAAAVDADNRLLWRMSPRRLEAEEIRDAMLAASGQLNLEEGGPGFRPFSVTISNSHFYTYEDRTGPEFNRRSIYRTVVNSGGIPLLEAFDCPDPSVKAPRRSSTTTPLQALALLNNSFVLRQAEALAARVQKEAGPDLDRQVDRSYRLAFGRPPSAAERDRAAAFVRAYGLAAFCRVLFNAGEFLYVR